jgi:serine phosphatase RsbU (regulator of sigma subunit)
MRIRTQLILATFLLAVVPLAAIVTYSYRSSRRALEAADRQETERLTRQMDSRLATIRADLDQSITLVSALPVADAASSDVDMSIAAAMGDVTNFVEGLEFKPLPAPVAKPVTKVVVVEEPEKSGPKEQPEPPEPPEPREAGAMPIPLGHAAPMLIDFPRTPMPRFGLSEQQRELLDEIARLGGELGNPGLSRDEREDLRKELAATQKQLNAIVVADARRYRDAMRHARHPETATATEAVEPVPAPVPTPAAAPVAAVAAAPKVEVRGITDQEIEKIRVAEKKAALILGKKFKAQVRKQGEVVGQLTPSINFDRVIKRVLGAGEDRDEIPFAIDSEGTVYTRNSNERATLERVGIVERVQKGQSTRGIPGWVVSTSTDKQSGLRIGVARPVGETLEILRRTAARNFGLGLGLIAFALIGIVPLSNHLTRDVKLVTAGAERIAQGDLMTRLPVKNDNELGQLARAFNRMAEDLSLQQQKLIDQEVQQRVMTVEYERKSVELEDARRFQLSMLPKQVPQHDRYDIAVYTRTATEVGGDYYDFHVGEGESLSVTIGDATGHGAKAGTMVTVIKTLFAGYDGKASPSEFLRDAAEKIKRMELGRMSMALSLARLDGRKLTIASAGMPPVLVHRAATGAIEEVSLGATPLGTLGVDYRETSIEVAAGDTLLFLTDGFPELMNDSGQQFGYAATQDAFASAARGATANEVIAALARVVEGWHGDAAPNDDVTFVVARVS